MSQSNSRLSTLLLPLLALALPPLSGCDVLAQLQDQFGPLAPDDAPVEPTEPAPSPSDPAPLVCESLGHTDEVVLSSQAEAEAFAAEFTSARVITIQGQELLDLDALDCLERVNALTANDTALERVDLPSLSFVGNFDFEENAELQHVSMPAVEEMWGLVLIGNPKLSTLSVPAVEDITGRVWLEDNHDLQTVDLRSLTGPPGFVVRESPSLAEFDVSSLTKAGSIELSDTGLPDSLDLSSLEETSGHILFARNHSLHAVLLDSLVETGQELVFAENAALERVDLSSLEAVRQRMSFTTNSSLTEIDLPKLTDVSWFVSIKNNDSLTRVNVPNLQSVGDPAVSLYLHSSLRVRGNPELKELVFSSLVSVGQSLDIYNNDALVSLNGFQSLQVVRGNLAVSNNLSLRDMTGIYGLESVGAAAAPVGPDAGNFVVVDNARLPIEQAEDLAYDLIGEDNIAGDIILRGVHFADDLNLEGGTNPASALPMVVVRATDGEGTDSEFLFRRWCKGNYQNTTAGSLFPANGIHETIITFQSKDDCPVTTMLFDGSWWLYNHSCTCGWFGDN